MNENWEVDRFGGPLDVIKGFACCTVRTNRFGGNAVDSKRLKAQKIIDPSNSSTEPQDFIWRYTIQGTRDPLFMQAFKPSIKTMRRGVGPTGGVGL